MEDFRANLISSWSKNPEENEKISFSNFFCYYNKIKHLTTSISTTEFKKVTPNSSFLQISVLKNESFKIQQKGDVVYQLKY